MTASPDPLSAADCAGAACSGKMTAREIVAASYARADAVKIGQDGLNAILWTDRDGAMAEARTVGRSIVELVIVGIASSTPGRAGPVPVGPNGGGSAAASSRIRL